jgi:hypothetical protein
MDKDNFIQTIDNHLEDIREQFEVIRDYEGKIPVIELDLIMSNIRKVYETLLKLEKLNQPAIPFNVQEPEPSDISVVEAEKTEEVPAQTSPVSAMPEVSMTVPVEKDAEPDQPKTTLDLFGEPASTLADSLKEAPEKRVADKLQGEKVVDIKAAIGINEKFLFINELFDGSLKNYEDAISKINQCQSEGEAGQVLEELQTQFTWAKENITAKSFIELVNRKF